MMTRKLISAGSDFENQFAYSRAVVQGDWCFVSGTTGYDYTSMSMPESVAQQATNAFETISDVLQQCDFSLDDAVRVQYTITDASLASELQPVLQHYLDRVRPAATMVVAGLIAAEMKVEIELTALRRSAFA